MTRITCAHRGQECRAEEASDCQDGEHDPHGGRLMAPPERKSLGAATNQPRLMLMVRRDGSRR